MPIDLDDLPGVLMVPRSMGEAGNWVEHIPFAAVLVRLLKPGLIVELGTEYGDSYLAMCQAVAEAGLGTRCFAVDTWQGDAHTGAYHEAVYQHVLRNHGAYATFSTLLRMRFDEALPRFADGSIDLLHIDGLHTYEAVRHDFDTWLPKVSKRGVVLFHDTAERGRDFGVWRMWEEVSVRWPSCHFEFGHGLGVLAVGPEVPAEVAGLMRRVREEAEVRAVFQRLGAGLAAMQTAGVLGSKVALAQDLVEQWKRLVGAQVPRVGGESPREVGDRLIQGVHLVASADLQLRQQVAAARQPGTP